VSLYRFRAPLHHPFRKPWTAGRIVGDGIHAMIPNLGQGGCQAIEDSYVLMEELGTTKRSVTERLKTIKEDDSFDRLCKVCQGLPPTLLLFEVDTPRSQVAGKSVDLKFENFNYAGIVTKILQPFAHFLYRAVQLLYDGWKNEMGIDLPAFGFLTVGGFIHLSAGSLEFGVGVGLGVDFWNGRFTRFRCYCYQCPGHFNHS
jgi:zeaxanthin epoxidase